MRGRLIGREDKAWTGLLGEVPHDFYHLPAYVDLSADQGSGRSCALLIEDGDHALLLPVIVCEIAGGRHDATSPYGYPGPIGKGLQDPAFVTAAFHEARRVLDAEGIVALFVRFHPVINRVLPDGIGSVVDHGETVAIDLTQPMDGIWRQTRENHRRHITRAIRSGHAVAFDDTEPAFETFKQLYRATMTRLGASAYYFFDDSYFDRLRSVMGQRMSLAVVRIGEEVAAAGLFVEEAGIVQYHLSGSDERFVMHQPTKLMIHFVTSSAKERGNRWFHLGGGLGASEDSLLHFKAGFSPLRLRFRTLRMVVDDAEYRRLVQAHDPTMDPTRLDGFFPAYRQR